MEDGDRASLQDQGMLVTNGTGTIGRSIVLAAVKGGASVVFGERGGEGAVGASILANVAASGACGRAYSVPVDDFTEGEIDRFFDSALDHLPEVHVVVVNDADTPAQTGRSFVDTTLTEWESTLTVGLRQPFLLCQRAVGEFLATGRGGRIVHVVTGAPPGVPVDVAHAATRQALRSFGRSLGMEYGRRGIAYNIISVSVPARRSGAAVQRRLLPQYESDRVGEAVLFLASAEASFVNGEEIDVVI